MNNPPLLVVLHGPNLNMLGQRPTEHYGAVTLQELERAVEAEAAAAGWDCVCRQTNHEGRFIEYVHEYRNADALVVNPGAWTHYSYAVRDALELVNAPIAEVHLSDIAKRESWRQVSVVSDVVTFTVMGRGVEGYLEAARRLMSSATRSGGQTS